MFEILLRKLTIWRNETAQKEGVDLFRVLPNKTLEQIARDCPQNKAQLIDIKGIKELKFRKYGMAILKIVKEEAGNKDGMRMNIKDDNLNYFKRLAEEEKPKEKIFSVSEFWDMLNGKLIDFQARVRGEVSSVDIRSNVVYFSIKDKRDESVMNCFIFKYEYDVLSVELKEGMVVVIEGYPEIYKPFGRMSLRTSVIGLEGEGELKKEYDRLRQKLSDEGVFSSENKKLFSGLPQNIGLITSKDGAAIGDFVSNIGKFGLRIKFMNSSVEGKCAVFELIDAIRYFKKLKDLDVLVIIRGGGSLESLQAFNNEALIREAKALNVPVVCGVGHDKDISLLSLAADYSVSTPTAAARLIGELWEREITKISTFVNNIFNSFEGAIDENVYSINFSHDKIENRFQMILQNTEEYFNSFINSAIRNIEKAIETRNDHIAELWKTVCREFEDKIMDCRQQVESAENSIRLNDPNRQLKMGYSIVSKSGSGIRSVKTIHKNDKVKIRLSDGELETLIQEIKKL